MRIGRGVKWRPAVAMNWMAPPPDRDHPAISVEVGDMDIDGVPSSRDIVLYLINKGYQPYEHIDGSIVRHQPKDRYEYGDLLFLWES